MLIEKGELLESFSCKQIETQMDRENKAEVGRRSITCKSKDGPVLHDSLGAAAAPSL